jgi:hypothetical protein
MYAKGVASVNNMIRWKFRPAIILVCLRSRNSSLNIVNIKYTFRCRICIRQRLLHAGYYIPHFRLVIRYSSRYLSAKNFAMLSASVRPSTVLLIPTLLPRILFILDQKLRPPSFNIAAATRSRAIVFIVSLDMSNGVMVCSSSPPH